MLSDDLDSKLDNEYISHVLFGVNEVLIREAYKKAELSPDLFTPTCCLKVECMSEAECVLNGLTVPTTGSIHYVEIDNLVSGIPLNVAIRYIGLSDYSTPIYIANSIAQFSTWEHRGISKHKPIGFLIGNKMYFKNLEYLTSSVTFLCMLALISNPTNLCDYTDDETIYRTPSADKLEYLTFQEIAIALGLRGGDEVNNANPDASIQRTPSQQQEEQQENE